MQENCTSTRSTFKLIGRCVYQCFIDMWIKFSQHVLCLAQLLKTFRFLSEPPSTLNMLNRSKYIFSTRTIYLNILFFPYNLNMYLIFFKAFTFLKI